MTGRTTKWLLLAATVAFAQDDGTRTRLQPAQAGLRIRELAAGKFLVARRDLPDPNFAETVVLLVHYDKSGAMGLVINRPTKVPLSRVLQDLKEAKERADPVYLGGPVEKTGALALLRSRNKLEEARHVFSDVYLASSRKLLEQSLAARIEASALRVYLGYSGWGAGQLEGEVELGTWHIFRGDAGMVFDPDPESVWHKLIQRTELKVAKNLHTTFTLSTCLRPPS